MSVIVQTKHDCCTGCSRCVRECPLEMANLVSQDEDGVVRVRIDHEKCIGCGRCLFVCRHDARDYENDAARFFEDLAKGVPISVIVAPAVKTNLPNYKKLFTYLKQMGVGKIYDVTVGADICIWAHIRYLEKQDQKPLITQPCPPIVKYCEIYQHDLLDKLSPIQSPMGCTSIYMKKYEGITDKIAAITPCAAKSVEFNDTGLAQYNVTLTKLLEHLTSNNIRLPDDETDFDHPPGGLGAMFPEPGGLKENLKFFLGNSLSIDTAEGEDVYRLLDIYAKTAPGLLPRVFDVLNCSEGCNNGSGCTHSVNVFSINRQMDSSRSAALSDRGKEHYASVHKMYDAKLDISDFMREYHAIDTPFPTIFEQDIEKAFEMLGKTDPEKQQVDCGACGNGTCDVMARQIALGVNIPTNCIINAMETAKAEHEQYVVAQNEIEFMREIHEREMELTRSRELNELQLTKLNLVVKGTKIGLWDMEVIKDDPVNPMNIFTWSDEFRHMLGFTDETDFPNLLGSWADRLHPDDKERVLDAFEKHMTDKTGKTPYDVEYRLMKKDGSYAYFRASGETIRAESGEPVRVAGALMDISEAKNTLLETERLRMEAENANNAKSTFLSTMSHEIRTPMNAILGITEIQLQNDALDSQVIEAFGKIYASGDMLLGIINDILDLSKIEAGKLELVNESYEMASLISDTAQLNMMRVGSKPIEFELRIDENLPLMLSGDELRVKQIFNNLLSNAFKYTASGTVTLTILAEDVGAGPANANIANPDGDVILIISISDTGQGMTKEQIDSLFDEYSRFNREANRATEGTGLGMSITRNLVRMMNGELTVESEPGKGTTFTVLLPQGRVGAGVLGRELTESLHQFRSSSRALMKRVQISRDPMPYGSVLVVDDVETNIYVAKGLLAPYGLQIDSADSGLTAIEKIKAGKKYDIVFMDHMMPVMDGMEATKIIRDMGYEHSIVALTANAVAGQANIFLENGFDDFISKPIDVRQLNAVLNKMVRDKYPPEVVEEARKQSERKLNRPTREESQTAIDPRLAEAFVRDASKTLAVLTGIMDKNENLGEKDLRTYTIHVHGTKSALASIGKMELSNAASKLEKAGHSGDMKTVIADTPAFLSSLQALIEDLTPEDEADDDVAAGETSGEDLQYLCEKLSAVKDACEEFDEAAADEIIEGLRERRWGSHVNDLLKTISQQLLHSDFDEVSELVEKYLHEQK